jgi:DNA-binding transcriptional ArsR family regulator
MLSDSSAQLSTIFVALAHPTRRAIVRTLAFRPATVTQLAEEHYVSLPAIHRHIRVLEQADLLQRRKVGRVNFVAQKREGIRAAQTWLDQFAIQFGNDTESLDNYIARLK